MNIVAPSFTFLHKIPVNDTHVGKKDMGKCIRVRSLSRALIRPYPSKPGHEMFRLLRAFPHQHMFYFHHHMFDVSSTYVRRPIDVSSTKDRRLIYVTSTRDRRLIYEGSTSHLRLIDEGSTLHRRLIYEGL